MKTILVTNDDGIKADGLLRLVNAAKAYGRVWVVAPSVQKSGASHSINLHTPIAVREVDFPTADVKAFAASGSPADCVRIGILNILLRKPDWVLAGINYGYNAGTDVMYSGTIGAAIEATFQGIPAVAFSEKACEEHSITDLYLGQVLEETLNTEVRKDEILNVNFPSCRREEFKGILRHRFVSVNSIFTDSYICRELSDGTREYEVHGEYQEIAEEGSDLQALFDDYISIGTVRKLS